MRILLRALSIVTTCLFAGSVAVAQNETVESYQETLRDSLRAQLIMGVVDAAQSSATEPIADTILAFRKKFPFLGEDDGESPFYREIVQASVEKTLKREFPALYEKVSKNANDYYAQSTSTMSPRLRERISAALPEALADLNTPQGRTEILVRATIAVQSALRGNARLGMKVPIVLTKESPSDPKLGNDTTLAGYAIAEPESTERLKQESPDALRHNGLREHTMEFARQSTLFNIPVAMIALFELGNDYAKNPLAFENFLNSLKDPAAHVSFAAFMATNSKVSRSLDGVIKGTIPRTLIPYIGMSAGLVVSTAMSELWHDRDVKACARSMFKLSPDSHRCEIAYTNWVLSRKIDAYLPSILSMSTSTLLSSLVQSGIRLAPHSRDLLVSFRVGGLRLVRGTAQVAMAGAHAGGPLAEIGTTGLFLVFDKVAYPKIDDWWRRTSLQKWDLARWISDSNWGDVEKGVHLILFRQMKLPNAEASTMPEVHANFRAGLAAAENRNWSAPKIQDCLPKDLGVTDLMNLGGLTRREQIRTCLVESDLITDIDQLGKLNEKWRQFLLRKVSASSDSWVQSLYSFNTIFNSATVTYKKMIDELHAQKMGKDNVRGEKIDLTLPAFEKVVQDTSGIPARANWTEEDEAKNEGVYPSQGDYFTPTPELVDSLLVSMACGPDMDASPTYWQRFKSTSWVPWASLHSAMPWLVGTGNIPAATTPVIETPFGSRFRLYPPAIVKSRGDFCREFYKRSNGNAVAEVPGLAEVNIHTTKLLVNGATYNGVLDYVVKNVDPELVGTSKYGSNFSLWWDEKVIQPSNAVWDTYRKDYVQFLDEQLVPLFSPQKVVQGCHSIESSCVLKNPKVTLPNSLTEAFQVQFAYHKELGLSILRSLPNVNAEQLGDVTARYNRIMLMFSSDLSAEQDHFEKGITGRELQSLVGQFVLRLNEAKLEENDYRRQVLSASFKQLSNVLNEREQVGRFLNILKFSSRDNLPAMSAKGPGSSDPRARSSH